MNEKSVQLGVLVYDSQCNLCLATKSWFEERDLSGTVGFISAHDPGVRLKFPQVQGSDLHGQITWIGQLGEIRHGADAIAAALQQVPSWKWVGRLLMLPGTSTLRYLACRMVTNHRYRWFGRSCDSGSCHLESSSAIGLRTRIWPACFSILVILIVASPILENFRPAGKAQDDFPLSYYPMFSNERRNLHQQSFVAAIKPDGALVPVHYRMLGTGGLNQNRRQLGKLLKREDSGELNSFLAAVAQRLALSGKPQYQKCLSVAAVNSTYDLNAYFMRQNQEPTDFDVVMEVPIPNTVTGLH